VSRTPSAAEGARVTEQLDETFVLVMQLRLSCPGKVIKPALMAARNYSWEDVLFTHPKGAVGKHADSPQSPHLG
jgi:D-arabinose 5-phosphate isomerase GutQ